MVSNQCLMAAAFLGECVSTKQILEEGQDDQHAMFDAGEGARSSWLTLCSSR